MSRDNNCEYRTLSLTLSAMLARSLLMCLALGLAGADSTSYRQQNPALENAINCSDIKTITDLNISEITGDWPVVDVMTFHNAIEVPGMMQTRVDSCIMFRVAANSTETEIDVSIATYRTTTTMDKLERKILQVDPENKGRWTHPKLTGASYLIVKADPGKYLVHVACIQTPDTAFPQHLLVMFHSRAVDQKVLLTDQELQTIKEDVIQKLGMPNVEYVTPNPERCYE